MPPLLPLRQDDKTSKSIRNRRLTLILAGLLLLAGGILWYLRDHRQYHIAMSFDDARPILAPRATGFLAGGEATPYSFYDWEGTLSWQVQERHRGRYIRTGAVLMETEKRYALSPDGRFLSVIDSMPWAAQVELRTWREGKQYRTMKIPLGTVHELHQMNDGSVYISGKRQNEAVKLLWVKETRVAAAVEHYRLLGISNDGGTALVSDTTRRSARPVFPCAIGIKNGRIVLRPVTVRFDCCSVYDKGVLLFSDGFIHRKGVTKPIVRHVPVIHILGQSRGAAVFNADKGRVLVISLVSGDMWSFRLKKGYTIQQEATGVSENGRFVAMTFQRDALLKLRRLYSLFPPLARLLPKRTRREVLLYSRPGRQIVNLTDVLGKQETAGASWYPSPDGRAVVGVTVDRDNHYRCVLLRKRR